MSEVTFSAHLEAVGSAAASSETESTFVMPDPAIEQLRIVGNASAMLLDMLASEGEPSFILDIGGATGVGLNGAGLLLLTRSTDVYERLQKIVPVISMAMETE